MPDNLNKNGANGVKKETVNNKNGKSKRSSNIHAGHRSKLRRRFLSTGLQSFEPHTALELLLFYALPQKDTNELAHTLIDTFGSLSGVFNASYEQLVQIKGVSENTASLICLIPQMFRMYARDLATVQTLSGRDNIKSFIYSQLSSETVEKLLFVCLDNKGGMISCDCVTTGGVDFAAIDMRKILTLCIDTHATAAIMAHNHPRGECKPSMDDVSATRFVKKALDTINIRLLDHIIITSNEIYSMCSDSMNNNVFRK